VSTGSNNSNGNGARPSNAPTMPGDHIGVRVSAPPTTPFIPTVVVRTLEVGMGALFLYLGATKLIALRATFAAAGPGAAGPDGTAVWLRIFTGALELGVGILLLRPMLARAAGRLLSVAVVTAIVIEVMVFKRPPIMAAACVGAHGCIAWGRRMHDRWHRAHALSRLFGITHGEQKRPSSSRAAVVRLRGGR
jgi:nitrate reductase NapE component